MRRNLCHIPKGFAQNLHFFIVNRDDFRCGIPVCSDAHGINSKYILPVIRHGCGNVRGHVKFIIRSFCPDFLNPGVILSGNLRNSGLNVVFCIDFSGQKQSERRGNQQSGQTNYDDDYHDHAAACGKCGNQRLHGSRRRFDSGYDCPRRVL